MNNLNKGKKGYRETESGSIDYNYYSQHANSIRSKSIFNMLKSFSMNNKISSIKKEKHISKIIIINNKSKLQLNEYDQAA